jgi:hypothetical protein
MARDALAVYADALAPVVDQRDELRACRIVKMRASGDIAAIDEGRIDALVAALSAEFYIDPESLHRAIRVKGTACGVLSLPQERRA